MSNAIEYGRVRWFDPKKGFGFIESNDNADIFLHKAGLKEQGNFPKPGEAVSFIVERTHKGDQAKDVVILDESELSANEADGDVKVSNSSGPLMTPYALVIFGAGALIGSLVTLALQ